MVEGSFGAWLKRRRLGLGLTQGQLAIQINCSTSALRKFESEERRPSAEAISQLIDFFNIPPEERRSFLRFARGDGQAFEGSDFENEPWRFSNIDQQSNLPSSLTSFVGRKKEEQDVIHLLEMNRLVTLTGAGGIGKTRLAIQAGNQLRPDYPHGVWFIPLESLSDPLRLPHAVAAVFGIQEGVDRQLIETLKSVLRLKTSLLILDNCEHLLDACTQLVNALLRNCPNLRILTTSREILKVEGEAIYSLPSLSTPGGSDTLEIIAEYESIRLFVERAALVLSTFQLTNENAPAIADICRRVDGIPLAIELIVAHLNILKVEEISRQLQNSFALLLHNTRTTLLRHQTLQASIDWSWSLLTEPEQVFLRQLSVFVGGWTLDAAQSVCAGNALRLTNSLAQKSLIMVDRSPVHETRYHFHETLLHYAHEKLVESRELEIVRNRHLRYFLELSEKIESGLRGIAYEEWFARALYERENLNAALEQAAKQDVEAGLYILARLEAVWEEYDLRSGECWLAEFLQNPESKQHPLARAKALCTQGWLFMWLGNFPPARAAAEESLSLFRTCKDGPGEIDALIMLGSTYSIPGNRAEGKKLYEQALALSQSLGDIWRQAKADYFLGWNHTDDQGYFADWEKAAALFGEAGDYRSQLNLLGEIAFYRVLNGDIELAQKYLDEARILFPVDRRIEVRGTFQSTKSLIELEHGDFEQAHMLMQETLDQAEKSGNRFNYLWAKARFGYLSLREGNISEARELFAGTAREFYKNKETIGVIFALEGMAGYFAAVGNLKDAARLIGWSDAARKEISDFRPRLEQRDIDKVIATCISKLGESVFTDVYHQGQEMTVDEAVALVLNEQ